jgi:hypothetical protein
MSQKIEKKKKRAAVARKKVLRAARKKKKLEVKYEKSQLKLSKKWDRGNLEGQLQQQESPSFDRSSWQALKPPGNAPSGSVKSAVLNREARYCTHCNYQINEQTKSCSRCFRAVDSSDFVTNNTASAAPIFNTKAWAPPNVE